MPRPEIHDLRMPKRLRMAMVAPSGFGKTVFAGTAPDALFLTTDPEGTASAAAFGSKAREIEISNEDQLIDAYNYLEQGGIDELGLQFVIVDNLTEVQAIFMARAMEIAVREGAKKGVERSKYVPDQHQYLTEQNATVDFVKKMCSLPVHLIFTVHRKGMEDGDGNDFFSAAIRGKQGEIAQMVLGYMNVIGMGEVMTIEGKGEVRRTYFDHVRQFRGKDRFVKLGKYRDGLTVPAMMAELYPNGVGSASVPATTSTATTSVEAAPKRRRRVTS